MKVYSTNSRASFGAHFALEARKLRAEAYRQFKETATSEQMKEFHSRILRLLRENKDAIIDADSDFLKYSDNHDTLFVSIINSKKYRSFIALIEELDFKHKEASALLSGVKLQRFHRFA